MHTQSSRSPLTVTLRARRPVSARDRWEVNINTVGFLLIWILAVIQYLIQTIIMFLEGLPAKLYFALPSLWKQTPGDFWFHPWDSNLGRVFFLFGVYFLGMAFACFQTRKAIDEFTLWLSSFHYHTGHHQQRDQRIVRRFSLMLLHTRESIAFAISLPSLHTLATSKQLYISVQECEDRPPLEEIPPIVENSAASVLSLPLSVEDQTDTRAITIPKPAHPTVHFNVLDTFTMWVVKPAGEVVNISFLNGCHSELVMYMVVRTYGGRWLLLQDILRDLYDCDDDAPDEVQKRARDLYHRHLVEIRRHIDAIIQAAGLPRMDIFEKMRAGRSLWRLSLWCRVDDLAVLTHCKDLLTASKKQETVDQTQLRAICQEGYALYKGDLLAVQRKLGQVRMWAEEPLRESVQTILDILKYLAEDARKTGEAAGRNEAISYRQREAQLWGEYAVCCARTLYDVAVLDQTQMSQRAEYCLRCSMDLYLQNNDPLAAADVYCTYEQLMLDEDAAWHPEPKTREVWQRVTLALQE